MIKKLGITLRMLVGLLLIVLSIRMAPAQSGNQGTLTITVQDKSGGIVPGAKLVLRDSATNDVRQAVTLSSGTYSFPALNASTYKLSISKPGYKDSVYLAVVVHASVVTDLTSTLDVGAVTDKVVVVADQTPLVETTSNVIGTTFDLKEIEDLPMFDRDITSFAYLLPGEAGGTWNNQPGQAQVNSIDGVIGNSSRFKAGGNIQAAASPRLQNISEMTVQTSGLAANQGFGQAAMQAVFSTRQGSNDFHFRVFANLQNSGLNANNWYNDYNGVPKPLYHKEDYGGSVGGAILKNRLFYFGSYEQDYVPGKAIPYNSFLTPALQQGNYTYLGTDGASHTVNLLTIAGAAGLQSTVDVGIAAELAKINSSLSLGTIGTVSGADQYESKNVQQLNFLEPNNLNYFYPTFRVDYIVNSKLRAYVAYNETKNSAPTTLQPSFPGPDFTWQQDGTKSSAYTAALGVDWTIKPTLVNQFQGGYLYNFADSAYKSRAGNYNMTHDIVWWNAPWGLNISDAGGASGDFFYSGISSFYPLFSLSDNLIWQHKSHNITVGGSFYREQDHYWNPPQGYNNVVMGMGGNDPGLNVFSTTNPALATANGTQLGEMQSYYALLSGDLLTVAGSHPLNPQTHTYSKYGALNLDELQEAWGLYFQDSWRVRSNLTVNYGMRWDFTGDDHDLNGIYYSPTNAGLWGPSGQNNAFNPGSFQGDADPSYYTHSHAYSPWNVSPQPNVGVAWTPTVSEGWLSKLLGGSDTVLRAGYSLRRYTPQYQDFWSYASDYGSFFYQNYSISAGNSTSPGYYPGGSLHYSDYLNGDAAYNSAPFLLTPISYSSQITEASQAWQAPIAGMDANIAQPYIQSWNVGIQRKLGRFNALEVRYVGNRAIHSWMALNPNEVNIFENGFLSQFKTAQANLATNGTSFQGVPGSTPIFDAAFQDNPTGGYTYGGFIYNLQHGEVGTMAGQIASPFGATSNYFCNLVSSSFTPCSNVLGYTGSGGPYPTNLFQANPYAAGSSVGYLTAAGYSNYNSLQVEFRQQNWHGMEFNANYTWSRSLGMNTQYTLRNLRLAYGPTSSDIHQIIHVYGTYDLPFGKGKSMLNGNGLLDRIVGNWTIGTIVQFHSGAPFEMVGGNQTYNNLFDGGINLVGVTNKQLQHAIGVYNVPGAPSYVKYWINPKYVGTNGEANSTYLTPNSTPGSVGTRYWLWGMHYWNESLSLTKAVTIRKRLKANMQAEIFDPFNHPVWGTGDANLQDSSFGITTYQSSTGINGYGRTIEIRGNIFF